MYTRITQPQKCPVSNGSYLLAHVTCFAVKEEIDSSRVGGGDGGAPPDVFITEMSQTESSVKYPEIW